MAFLATSCIEDGFTYSSSDLLEFSTDTVSFDTLFTELGSPTHQFVIYNRHKKMINISSISIQGNDYGKFYINVDGMKGESFHDVEIRGEDSIYVFVESYIDPTNQNTPLRINDRIEFVTNGVTQSVVLTAWGQDVTRLTRPEYSEDAVLTADRPYVIFDTLHVAEGATLTINEGVTLYFHDKAAMKIDGTLKAMGSQSNPIHFRGDRTDYLFEGANYNIMTAQWGGVHFTTTSTDNELNYVLMRGSTNGLLLEAANADTRALHIFNSMLHNASTTVFTAKNAWVEAEGCEFSDAGGNVVALYGGNYHFAQCTFANNFIFGLTGDAIVNIATEDDEGAALSPTVYIDNSIISGLVSEFNIGDFSGYDVYIRNSMIKSTGSDDDNFLNCTWGGDAKFYVDRQSYIFDYRIGNSSNAIAAGSPSLCPSNAAVDRYGVTRLRDANTIDAGAYTWVYNADEETE